MHSDRVGIVWAACFAWDWGRYVVAAGVVFLVVWVLGRERFASRLIQKKWATKKDMRREIAYSVSTALVFSLVGTAITFGARHGIFHLYFDFASRGAGYFVFSIAALIVMHDTYFYWTHRAMHHRALFKHVHRVHHRSHNPSPWAAYAFAPAEALVQAGYVPLALLFMPVHELALFAFLGFMITRNVVGHAGVELFPRGWVRTFGALQHDDDAPRAPSSPLRRELRALLSVVGPRHGHDAPGLRINLRRRDPRSKNKDAAGDDRRPQPGLVALGALHDVARAEDGLVCLEDLLALAPRRLGVELDAERRREHRRGEVFGVVAGLLRGLAVAVMLGEVTVVRGSAGRARPIEAAMSRFGSFVSWRAITQWTICPGLMSFSPSLRLISLQRGGKIELTVTRFAFSIPASRSESSNDESRSL